MICPDGGFCHHACQPSPTCFRVQSCGPLSGVFPGDRWPAADTVDIPDEREPEHHIPDAVCDVQTEAGSVLGPDMVRRIVDWLVERERVSAQESTGDFPPSGDWHASDDDAADIVRSIATLFEIEPPPPDEQWEGPTCSICDGLGHGYPGGGPCPLEERGYDDARQDEERF